MLLYEIAADEIPPPSAGSIYWSKIGIFHFFGKKYEIFPGQTRPNWLKNKKQIKIISYLPYVTFSRHVAPIRNNIKGVLTSSLC